MLYHVIYAVLVRWTNACPCAEISYIYTIYASGTGTVHHIGIALGLQILLECAARNQVNEMMGLSLWSASSLLILPLVNPTMARDWEVFSGPFQQIQVVGCQDMPKENKVLFRKSTIWFKHVWVKHSTWCPMCCCNRYRSMTGRYWTVTFKLPRGVHLMPSRLRKPAGIHQEKLLKH